MRRGRGERAKRAADRALSRSRLACRGGTGEDSCDLGYFGLAEPCVPARAGETVGGGVVRCGAAGVGLGPKAHDFAVTGYGPKEPPIM